jgi:hypothetical protein
MATGKQTKGAAKRAAKKVSEELDLDDVVESLGKRKSSESLEDTVEALDGQSTEPKRPAWMDEPETSGISKTKAAAGLGAAGAPAYGVSGSWGSDEEVEKEPEPSQTKVPDLVGALSDKPTDKPEIPGSTPPPGLAPAPKFVPGKTEPDSYFKDFYDKAQAIFASTTAMEPAAKDEFAEELRKIRATYDDAKTTLEKRELAHTLADALTQFGAGYWGTKTGQDLTNLKLKDHDFTKDLALLQDELKTNLADLRSRREEDIKKRERVADVAMKQADLRFRVAKEANDQTLAQQKLQQDAYNTAVNVWKAGNDDARQNWAAGEQARHNMAMETYQAAMLEARNTQDKGEAQAKAAAAFERLKADTNEDIARIMNTPEFRKDPEKGMAAIIPLTTRLGIEPDQARAAVFQKGMWGPELDDPKGEIDAAVGISKLIRTAGQAPQMIKMSHPKHGTVTAPNEAAAAKMEAAGWQRT